MCNYKKNVILEKTNEIDTKLTKSKLKELKKLLKDFKKRHKWKLTIKK